jgi:hypothetical protein
LRNKIEIDFLKCIGLGELVMLNIRTVMNDNPKTMGYIVFLIGALSLSFALKMLGEAIFPPYILKYMSEKTLFIYIGLISLLSLVSYKFISKGYTMLSPYLK